MSAVFSILLVIIFFGGSIFVHELGHYIAAKKRKLFVPKFSIGFGPKLFGYKHGKTEFTISLLPLGGYVAIPQLAELSEVEGNYSIPLGSKNATNFDKIVVAVAGPIANIVFAFFLAIAVYMIGLPIQEESLETTIGYVSKTLTLHDDTEIISPAYQAGLIPGDKIISIDGHKISRFDEISELIALGKNKNLNKKPISSVTFERDGQILEMIVFPKIVSDSRNANDAIRTIGISPKQNLIIDRIHPLRQIELSNILKKGDRIISANGIKILNVATLHEITNNSKNVSLQIERSKKILPPIEIPIAKLATLKPFVSLQTTNKKAILDIIPSTITCAQFDEINDESFSNFQIFCSDRNLLKAQRISNGDKISLINGIPASSIEDVKSAIDANSSISMQVQTKFGPKTLVVTKSGNANLQSTVFKNFLGLIFEPREVIDHPSPWKQLNATIATTNRTLSGLFSRNSDISVKHLMGPAGLVKSLYSFASSNFSWLLWFVILINVNLAILNLLPLPVLDGGIITIAIVEQLTHSKSIGKIFSKIQYVFIVLLLGLMAYVTFFDFQRIWAGYPTFESQKIKQLMIQYDHLLQ